MYAPTPIRAALEEPHRFERLQRLLASGEVSSRWSASRLVCEAFDLRDGCGRLRRSSCMAALAGLEKAGRISLPASTGDDALRAELAERIYRHPFLERYGRLRQPSIHIIVERGHVTLTGAVDSPGDKQTAGSIVNGTFGVLSVRNNLFVTTR